MAEILGELKSSRIIYWCWHLAFLHARERNPPPHTHTLPPSPPPTSELRDYYYNTFFSWLSPLTPCRHAALHSPLRQPFRKPDDAVLLAWIIQVQSHALSFVYRGNFHFSSCLQNATMHLRLKPLKSLATFRWQNICSESTEDNSCIQRRISIGYRHSPPQCLVYSIKTLELINCHILLPGESFINNKEIHYLSSPSN